MMIACGDAAIEEISKLVVEATEKTMAAESPLEVMTVAVKLQEDVEKISKESGNKIFFGKSVDAVLESYKEVTAAKLAEFGLELEY